MIDQNVITTAKLAAEKITGKNVIVQETRTMLDGYFVLKNKEEGIELANKVLKYRNTLAESINNPLYKQKRDISYEKFCEVNKTGIDFEF